MLANAVYIGDCRSRFLPTWALGMEKRGVACWRGSWRGLLRESWRRGNSIIALLRGWYYCFMGCFVYYTWLIDLADLKKFKQLPFSKRVFGGVMERDELDNIVERLLESRK